MIATAEAIEPGISIKDDKFSVDRIDGYDLLLQYGAGRFRIAIFDTADNRCLFFEDYDLSRIFGHEKKIQAIDAIYDNHILLQAGFWKSIKVAIKNEKFTLLPYSLFNKECMAEYLRLNCDAEFSEEQHYYRHAQHDIVNVFSTDKRVTSFFRSRYPTKTVEFIHHTSAFIEGVLRQDQPSEKAVYMCVEEDLLTIMVRKNDRLEFCNNFYFKSPEDLLYYVVLVMNELNMDREADPVIIWGETDFDSEIYGVLYKYIRYVNFGERPKNRYFGYLFDEVFDHRFFDLFNMQLCG